jgi:hypothetical protein
MVRQCTQKLYRNVTRDFRHQKVYITVMQADAFGLEKRCRQRMGL